jgi:hypothetical protein
MNILFYIDPHVLRENPMGYWPIISRLYKTLYSHHQHCKTPMEYNFKLLVTKHPQPDQPFIAALPEKVNRQLLKFNSFWDNNAVEQWELLMRGEGLISELYHDILFYLMKKYSVDAFVYWGSNHTAKKFAESFNRYSFAMELGPTRKPFFESAYLDPLGVNGDAYSMGLNIDDFPGCDITSLACKLGFEYDFHSAVHKPIQSEN